MGAAVNTIGGEANALSDPQNARIRIVNLIPERYAPLRGAQDDLRPAVDLLTYTHTSVIRLEAHVRRRVVDLSQDDDIAARRLYSDMTPAVDLSSDRVGSAVYDINDCVLSINITVGASRCARLRQVDGHD